MEDESSGASERGTLAYASAAIREAGDVACNFATETSDNQQHSTPHVIQSADENKSARGLELIFGYYPY